MVSSAPVPCSTGISMFDCPPISHTSPIKTSETAIFDPLSADRTRGPPAGSGANDRVKKAMQVNVVADSRIQAVIVTAPKDLMDQIADMMTDLDVPSTRDQKVFVFQMKNGDPQQAAQVLQNMFQSGGTTRTGSSSSQNSPLMQRAQNNTTSSSSSGSTSGFGTTGGGRGGAAGGLQF